MGLFGRKPNRNDLVKKVIDSVTAKGIEILDAPQGVPLLGGKPLSGYESFLISGVGDSEEDYGTAIKHLLNGINREHPKYISFIKFLHTPDGPFGRKAKISVNGYRENHNQAA